MGQAIPSAPVGTSCPATVAVLLQAMPVSPAAKRGLWGHSRLPAHPPAEPRWDACQQAEEQGQRRLPGGTG